MINARNGMNSVLLDEEEVPRSSVRSIAALAALVALLGLVGQVACAQGLADIYKIRDGAYGTHMEYHQVTIPRGKEVVLADLTGPGKVTYWYITDDTNGKIYPGLVLKAYWDNEQDPSIAVPLADFFGAMGGQTIDYQSAPLKIEHLCYMCYLPMPFARRARFVLANDGDRDYSQSVAYGFDHETRRDLRP